MLNLTILYNKQTIRLTKKVINHCEYVKIINIDMGSKNGPIQSRFISTG